MAMAGIASRRKSEALILEGKVKVNGETINTLGVKVDPDEDEVIYEDKIIKIVEEKVYYLINKPTKIVTTSEDQFGRKTVLDLLEGVDKRVYPVGRLDYDSCGLILLTNDGDLTQTLTHPSGHVSKTYKIRIRGNFQEEDKEILEKGMEIDDYTTKEAIVKDIIYRDGFTEIYMVLFEGRNRQIRKMFEVLEYELFYLERVSIGNLTRNLKYGEYVQLTEKDIKDIWR